MFVKNVILKIDILLIFLCIPVLTSAEVFGESTEYKGYPSLVKSLDVGTELDFCGEKVPFESQEIRERFEKELMLTLWDRPQVILWLKRSRRYLPYIEDCNQALYHLQTLLV